MFGCIYQLWDWLEAPPLFTAGAMDAKKLQHLQQQQQQQQQKKMPLAYQTNISDYRTTTHSPLLQQQQQQQQQQQHNYHLQSLMGGYQQSPTTTNSSSGPLTPIDIQPQATKLLLKHHMGGGGGAGTGSSSSHSSPYHQQYGGVAGEQLYASPPERTYLPVGAGRLQQQQQQHNPSTALQSQYQQLQQAKMHAQLQTQSEAMQQQQRTFAMRQQINPPIPQGHYHMSQSSSIMSSVTLQQQQQQQQQQSPVSHQRAPPSTLNLSSQFQPAAGPLKVGQAKPQQQQQQHYHQQQQQQQQEQGIYAQQQQQLQLQLQLQHQQQLQQQQQQLQQHQQQQQQQQQRLKSEQQTPGSEQSPVYIQQNHPGHVVNQACQTQISAVKPGAGAATTAGAAVPKTPNSEDSSGRSPAHAPLDRKKSSGSIQALKSPMTKRPASSTVTTAGWLYKQGSDGLKVWRKRWFVLAEYCLYYYKGPEEEKLLGSILLPSYRVSACLPEDKIYRKFAFKCEHQNMRTYWLAAESGESMVQWVRALTAASMMQAPSSGGESDQASQPSVSSSLNHSGENSDSGIHTLQSQQSKMSLSQGLVTPASDSANANAANAANSGSNGGPQPLYANAPPKPRRINDGGYSSPSPEHSIDNERSRQSSQQQQPPSQQGTSRRSGVMSPTLQQQLQQQQQYQQQLRAQQQAQQHHAIYDARTGNVTSTLRLQQQQQQQLDNLDSQFQQQLQLAAEEYVKSPASAQNYLDMEEQIMRLQHQQQQQQQHDIYGERELHMQKLIQQRYSQPSAERRTPDAYGRSKNRVFSDYEDIYNLTQSAMAQGDPLLQDGGSSAAAAASYRRPLSPPSYESNKHVPSMPSRYTPNHLEASADGAPGAGGSSLNLRSRSSTAAIVRPHSADFLEYEARSEAASGCAGGLSASAAKPEAVRAPRPKSSLDINRTPDSFYYSEASYAEKMRKSALYLQHPQSAAATAQPQQPSGAYRGADIYSPGNVNTIGYENPYERVYKRGELLAEAQGGASSMPRMSRSMGGAGLAAHARSASSHPHPQHQQQQQQPPYFASPAAAAAAQTPPQYLPQSEQFLRSASARLPKRGAFDDEYVAGVAAPAPMASGPAAASASASASGTATNSHLDGERKREESMKRLLEWKQRMLQSPLTRKGVQQTAAGGPGSNMTAMSKLGSNPNILLASTTVASGAHRVPIGSGGGGGAGSQPGHALVGGVGGIQRSRSESHANGVGPTAGYNSYSSDDEASISVRNVRNLPKSGLTVKPDPTDPFPQQATLDHYDQLAGSAYYGSAHDTKFAKTTPLADKGYFGGVGGAVLPSSTPLHPHAGVANGSRDYFGGSVYDVHQGGGFQQPQAYPMRRVGSRAEIDMLERETSSQMRNLDVSAGDLLSRTHEELVLLLIQLRRQNSNTARAIEQCCTDIHEVQNRLRTAEGLTRAESIQRLDYLKQHLLDLERQYEKSKPLVNLVDNMVKLGSLYRTNDVNGRQQQQQQLQQQLDFDRLEFNQRIQEQRMLQEEQKQWDRLSPNQTELQEKVQQLYYLDQLLQEESGTLQSLQRDKEDLERALGGIRARIQDTNAQPLALEAAKKQQHMLERELSRVHQLLAENSKKLEQTVAGNARLEQELLVLRQKLQISRGSRDSQGLFVSDTYTNNTTAMLESELKRVQTLVGDMQRQRQELSAAVRQLTENSTRLYQEIGNKQAGAGAGGAASHIKKRSNSTCWIETDLDSMHSVDRTLSDSTLNLSTPLYVDTSSNGATSGSAGGHALNSTSSSKYSDYNTGGESLQNEPPAGRAQRSQFQARYHDSSDTLETSGVDSDGFLETNPFAGLSSQEKQEIKTVRIVKRESERRQRDRERSGLSSSTQNLDQVLEEDQQLALLQGGYAAPAHAAANGYADDYQAGGGRSKSLPRPSYTETPKSRHHHKHSHRQSFHGGQANGRYSGPGQAPANGPLASKYGDYYADKNSNYSSLPGAHHGQGHLTNGAAAKEHLNPLASAYFAKHHQQQQLHSAGRNSAQAALRQKTDSMLSLNKSITDLGPGPVFQSEAARAIISELSAGSASEDTERAAEKVPAQHKHRRAVPREKRRHYTAPNNVNVKAMENVQAENDMNRNNTNWRARDDLDMEVALRPRMNAPDVVRSALGHGEKISENTIDNLLLAPNKIVIPERYIPEKAPELSPEEKKRRQEKVESIKKMLAETPISAANDAVSLPPSKMNAEKKQREHLLQLNQILAQQVMQMSKIVAEKAMSRVNKMKNQPAQNGDGDDDEDDRGGDYDDEDDEADRADERRSESPAAPLPIFQQRDNFFT